MAVTLVGLSVLVFLIWVIIRISRGRGRAVLWAFAILFFAGLVGLGVWAFKLPEGRISSQVTRGAAIIAASAAQASRYRV